MHVQSFPHYLAVQPGDLGQAITWLVRRRAVESQVIVYVSTMGCLG